MAFVYDEETGKFVSDLPNAGMPPPQAPAPEESGVLRRTVGDAATAVAKGVLVGLPQAAVGLANIATLGVAEKPLGALGDSISAMGERIDKKYSTQHQQQAEDVANTKGFLPTVGAFLSRPGYLVDTAIEQLPTMFGGAKAGQLAGKHGLLGKGVAAGYAEGAGAGALTESAIVAGAAGEGAVTAGQNAEHIRQESGGETSFGQRAAATAAGVVTGALTFGAGKLANKLGIATPETYFAGAPGATTAGKLAADGTRMEFQHAPGTLSRVGRGVLTEGVFEELPQSMQEQMWNNVALDRPLMDGVPEAAGQGLVLGGAMGGTVAGRVHNNKLSDGVSAIQYLSQPPQMDDAGKPIVDVEKANAAFSALTALHPPATPERQSMDDWRADQLASIAKGEQIDWAAFGAITTNHGLLAMAAAHIADVRARQDALQQQAEINTAIANGQLPANVVDDMGNEVSRQQMPAPTKQELAQADRLQRAMAAGDTETLAREQGMLVRQDAPAAPPATTVMQPPTAQPPASSQKAAAPLDYSKWNDANLSASIAMEQAKGAGATKSALDGMLAEQAGRADGSRQAPPPPLPKKGALKQAVRGTDKLSTASLGGAVQSVEDAIMARNYAEAQRIVNEGVTLATSEKAAGKNHKLEQWTRMQAFVTAHSPKGTGNVQATNVNQGAKSKPAPSQAPAPVPQAAPGPDAQGDAASQPAEKAPQKVLSKAEDEALEREFEAAMAAGATVDTTPVHQEVTPPKESTNESQPVRQESSPAGSQSSPSGKVEAKPDAAGEGKKRKPVRQKGAADEGGNATPVRQEVAPKVRTAQDVAAAKAEYAKASNLKAKKAVTDKLGLEEAAAALNGDPDLAEEVVRSLPKDQGIALLKLLDKPTFKGVKDAIAIREADKELERDIKAAEAQAKLETPEQAWDRLRGDRATAGPRYLPTWAEMKAFVKDVADARKAANEADPENKPSAQSLAALAKDEARAKALTDLMEEFNTDRVYGSKAFANSADLLAHVAEARGAPWRAEYKQIREDNAKAVKDSAFREALGDKISKMIETLYDNNMAFTQKQIAEFMPLYKAYFKGAAKPTFDAAVKHIINDSDFSKNAKGVTIPSIRVILAATSGTNSLPAILDTINALSTSPLYKPLAAMARAMGADGVKFVYEDKLLAGKLPNGTDGYARGKYNQATNTLTIYRGGENPQTILHEVVHALTVNQLGKAAQLIGKVTNQGEAQALKGYRQLTELYEYLAAQPEMAGQYAFKNIKEFVAEVHTNPKLQAKLKEMPAPQGLFGKTGSKLGNMLQKYLDALLNLLGLKPGAVDALSKALELTTPYFAPNTAKTSNSVKQGAMTGASDAMVSPIAAMEVVSKRAGAYLKSMDSAAARGFWTNTKAGAAKALLSVTSSGTIEQYFRDHPALSFISAGFQSFFKKNEEGAQVRNALMDAAVNGHARDVEIALRKTGRYDHYNSIMGLIAGESSNIGFDPSRNFDANLTTYRGLDGKLKDHINHIHAEYMKLANGSPEEKAIAKLLKNGERVSRLMYVEQTAALTQSALRHLQSSNPKAKDAATDVLNKFGARIDLLQDERTLANDDPGKHYNALSSSLDKSMREMFKYVESTYPMSDIAAEMKEMETLYGKGIDAPYMHLGRHGMYYVRFSVADGSAQTTATLQQLLKPYNVVIGPFHGSRREVFLRVDNQAIADDIRASLLKQPGLIASKEGAPNMASGAVSTSANTETALGQSRVARELRSRLKEKLADMTAKGTSNPALDQAYDDMKAAINDSLMDMLEVNSARQAGQKRDHVPGYSANYIQNFSKRAQWAVSSIANVYTADGFAGAFREMQQGIDRAAIKSTADATRGQQVHDELAKRFSNSYKTTEHPFIRAASVFGNNFYLALSPAYAIGNLMQPYMLTLPYLGGKFGFVKAAKSMARASADAAKIINAARAAGWKEGGISGVIDLRLDPSKMGLPADETEFVRHLIRTGIVDSTQAHELGRMADGDTSSLARGAKVASLFNHYTEVANRLSTGLVAYRLAQGTPEKRAAFAKESILRTQFDYSEHNTARAIGRHGFLGAATPLFMQFQRFAFFTMEHYALMAIEAVGGKEGASRAAAAKGLLGTLGATALVTGTMGLPFTSAIVAVANALRGGDDDDKDLREEYREWLARIFGKDMAELVAKGVLARGVVGIDLTGSLGQQDLIPGSRFAADRREWKDKMKDQSKTMLGPAMNGGLDIYAGAQQVADGNIAEGVKAMLPRALKGPWAAGAVAGEGGEFKDKSGRTLPITASWADFVKMAAGFTPAAKAEQAEESFMYQSQLYQRKQDKAKAEKQIIKAQEAGEFAEATDVMQEYAANHPDNPIRGVSSMLQARARGQAIGALTGIIEPNKRNFPLLQDYTSTYNFDQ